MKSISQSSKASRSLPDSSKWAQFYYRRIIWSALGQGLSTGGCGGKGFLHSCWPKETWEFPAGNSGILQLGFRDRREKGTASVSQAPGSAVGQGEEEATCATSNTTGVWGRAGI